jgi:hypothetical protein
MSEEQSRVGEYLARAATLRALAAKTRYPEVRQRLLVMATGFERLADQVERPRVEDVAHRRLGRRMPLTIRQGGLKHDCGRRRPKANVRSSDMPGYPIGPEPDANRYAARPLGGGDWCVWDTRRDEPVFETEMLREGEAREAARRLSQAYRQALFRESH